jgi:hypothetical protein
MMEHDEYERIQTVDPASRIKNNQRTSNQFHLKKKKDIHKHQVEKSSLVDSEGHQPQENQAIRNSSRLIRTFSENEP